MKHLKRIIGLKISILLCLLTIPSWLPAVQSPLSVIRSGSERALKILRNCDPGKPVSLKRHRPEIMDIVHDYFDFREMAMRTLGHNWKKQPAQKRERFVKAFEQLLFNTYIDRIDSYTCSNEKVIYEGEQIRGRYAQVKTRVVGYRGNQETPVEYRMKLKGNQWMVYDVVVEGVSLINNYRSQFSSILNRKSFDELLVQMNNKIN